MTLTDALRRQLGTTELDSTATRSLGEAVEHDRPVVKLDTHDLLPPRGARRNKELAAGAGKLINSASMMLRRLWRTSIANLRRWRGGKTKSQEGTQGAEDYLLQVGVQHRQADDGSVSEPWAVESDHVIVTQKK